MIISNLHEVMACNYLIHTYKLITIEVITDCATFKLHNCAIHIFEKFYNQEAFTVTYSEETRGQN